MKWDAFLRDAYPAPLASREADASLLWRTNRWVGLRWAYLFLHLGLTANGVSVLRVVLAAGGFWLLGGPVSEAGWRQLVGVGMLALQVNLDYADGPLARVRGESSELGEALDGLANAAARAVVLVWIGYLARGVPSLVVGAFTAYILVTFQPAVDAEKPAGGRTRPIEMLSRPLLRVPVMVVGLPLLELGATSVGWRSPAARVLLVVYALLALAWLVLLARSPGGGDDGAPTSSR